MDQAVDQKPLPNLVFETRPASAARPFDSLTITPVRVDIGDGRHQEVLLMAAATGGEGAPSSGSPKNQPTLSPAARDLMTLRAQLIALYPQPGTEGKRSEKLEVIVNEIEANAVMRMELGATDSNGRLALLEGLSNSRSKPPGTDQRKVMEALFGREIVTAVEEAKVAYQEISNRPLAVHKKSGNGPEFVEARKKAVSEQQAFAKARLATWGDRSGAIEKVWDITKAYHYYRNVDGQMVSGRVPPFKQVFRSEGR